MERPWDRRALEARRKDFDACSMALLDRMDWANGGHITAGIVHACVVEMGMRAPGCGAEGVVDGEEGGSGMCMCSRRGHVYMGGTPQEGMHACVSGHACKLEMCMHACVSEMSMRAPGCGAEGVVDGEEGGSGMCMCSRRGHV